MALRATASTARRRKNLNIFCEEISTMTKKQRGLTYIYPMHRFASSAILLVLDDCSCMTISATLGAMGVCIVRALFLSFDKNVHLFYKTRT